MKISNGVDKNYLIQLTQNLYRLTLLFPKKEPLRYKMRELADDILVNSLRITCPPEPSAQADGRRANQYEYTNTKNKNAESCSPQILEDLEIMDSFFEVAKSQNWVSPDEILQLQKEYSKLKEELKKTRTENYWTPTPIDLRERQRKILEILKENGQAQVWQVKKFFPDVTKRTLRRDFEFLLKEGKIERIGERNETFYQVKG